MIAWSTDHLPPQDRFEYWNEERVGRLFSVGVDIAPERRLDFSGRMRLIPIGPATLIEGEVSAYTMNRTRRLIDRSPDGCLYVRHVVRGGGLTVVGDSVMPIRDGAITTGLGDLPHTNMPDPNRPEPGGIVTLRAVKIPLEALSQFPAALDRLIERQHSCASGIDALLHTYLTSFVEQAPGLAGAEAEQAVQTLAQLVLGARGARDVRDEIGAAAVREGLFERARRLIERDLHRTDLTPAHVAAELGVSLRKLHLVFEPSGESVSRHLLARRLARADRLLRGAPHLSVTEVAYASGFEALSTFFRCYRAAFGFSPSERRAAPPDENGPDDPARPHLLRA